MTYSMSTAAARKASKKTQHVRSAGDWITLILLVAELCSSCSRCSS